MKKNVREMRCLLVTGGCGFIGTNFVRYLLQDANFDGQIVNVDKLTYAGNPENLADVAVQYPERYVFEQVDICDFEKLKGIFEHYGIDSISHFAAESHVDRSIVAPDAFIQTNIVGTFNLLELARTYRRQLVLFHHVSTDEVFGSLGDHGAFSEETPYRPNSPYSASKAASDHLVRAYHKTYDLPVTLSNCSNNYGPYQFPEKLIPLVILNALSDRPLPVYGDGKNVRDWLYVRDHCRAIWRIMKRGRSGQTYNVGGASEMQNIAVVEMVCDILDELVPPQNGRRRRELITFVDDRPGHDRRYAIDFTHISKTLNWRPAESFASGLRKTVQWYLDQRRWVQRVQSGRYREWIRQQYHQPRARRR